MDTGTLMVLKRFLIIALGALWAWERSSAGTVMAQDGPKTGNIPAPDERSKACSVDACDIAYAR